MPLFVDTGQSASALELRSANCITIGLINNMPDAAVEATERQFTTLIRTAASGHIVRLKLFVVPELPRASQVRRELAGRYRDISELWSTHLDGLIVTGTEPRAASLKEEPYWATVADIVDWAREHTAATIWSCLAAHAVVLHDHGIERRRLPEKQFGVFDCDVAAAHPVIKGLPPRLPVPHSRYNDLPEPALASCGYRILTRSAEAGVDMFTNEERHRSFFLFLQGHPEYEPGTLLREYRRDVIRFLRGEREHYPPMPQNYFSNDGLVVASAFAARAIASRHEALFADFPLEMLEAGLEHNVEPDWHRVANGLYERWIGYLGERKREKRTLTIANRSGRRSATRSWPTRRIRPAADG